MAKNWRNILYNPERYLGLRRPVADSALDYQEFKKPQSKKFEEKKYVGQCFSCPCSVLCRRIKGINHSPFCFYQPLPIIRDKEREEKYEVYTNGNGNLPLFEPVKPRVYDLKRRNPDKWRRHGLLKDKRIRKMDRVRSIKHLPLSDSEQA